jgi:cyanophycin synthetase
VPDGAISVIPDEQEAIDAALRMGRPGDLLLVFSDALVRSWKQITKFRPDGTQPEQPARGEAPESAQGSAPGAMATAKTGEGWTEGAGKVEPFNLEGLIRDGRGVRVAPETED